MTEGQQHEHKVIRPYIREGKAWPEDWANGPSEGKMWAKTDDGTSVLETDFDGAMKQTAIYIEVGKGDGKDPEFWWRFSKQEFEEMLAQDPGASFTTGLQYDSDCHAGAFIRLNYSSSGGFATCPFMAPVRPISNAMPEPKNSRSATLRKPL